MYLSYLDCRKCFGSPYQIDKAVADGHLQKIEAGVYSDGVRVSELGTIQFKYPKGILAFESAYFYHDLTDAIPDAYHLATLATTLPLLQTTLPFADQRWIWTLPLSIVRYPISQ